MILNNNLKILISVFLIILILYLVYRNYNMYNNNFIKSNNKLNGNQQVYNNENIKKNHIFISIASYRDDLCPNTLLSCFKNAKYPERIVVGICQQNMKNDDPECVFPKDDELKLYNKIKNNIKILRLSAKHAKGPTYARWLCSTMWYNEEFYLQIDSHSEFDKNWDEKIINDIRSYNNKKIVLSYYPPDITDNSKQTSYSCKVNPNPEFIHFEAHHLPQEKNNYPIYTKNCAAGFLFTYGYEFLNLVPFDPQLPFLFQGEEFLLSARLFTNGFDLITPKESVLRHRYDGDDINPKKFWKDSDLNWENEQIKSIKKLKRLIKKEIKGGDNDDLYFNKYAKAFGFGKVRSIVEYLNYLGLDPKTFPDKYTNNDLKSTHHCGKLWDNENKEWVSKKVIRAKKYNKKTNTWS